MENERLIDDNRVTHEGIHPSQLVDGRELAYVTVEFWRAVVVTCPQGQPLWLAAHAALERLGINS